MSLSGHFWTIAAHLRAQLRPVELGGQPWSARVDDPDLGAIELTGARHPGGHEVALLLVHGLGGCSDSPYVVRMAAAAIDAGHPVVRMNLRGADRRGADIYHAGLTADVRAALDSPELAGRTRAVIGFSLGGHVSLRLAAERPDGLAAVCSICAPLDLAAGADHIDRSRSWVYRRHLFRGLREIHAGAHQRGRHAVSPRAARRIATLREWDDRIVAARFGFDGAADYYARMSAGPVLNDIECPALIAWAPGDPMVPPGVARPAASIDSVESLRLAPGGHVGFPDSLGLERQVLDWVVASV